ncbi:hypothetical protein [Treponema socranskii]|uniref:hypothetical protein n=1 Tax=Treponema socranskii TaxID=53419 RepID=UPI0028E80067|nr:hypothetical protein [Treponema socranskii]
MKKFLFAVFIFCIGGVFYSQKNVFPQKLEVYYFPTKDAAKIIEYDFRFDLNITDYEKVSLDFKKKIKAKKYSKEKYTFNIYKVVKENYRYKKDTNQSKVIISLACKKKNSTDVNTYCSEMEELFSNALGREVRVSIKFPDVYVSFDTNNAVFSFGSSAQETLYEGTRVTLKWIQPIYYMELVIQYDDANPDAVDVSKYLKEDIGK